jgi:hypothetical protein
VVPAMHDRRTAFPARAWLGGRRQVGKW